MTTPPRRPTSGQRLRHLLAATPGTPGRLYQSEALYHAQVRYTCDLLDIVDAFTDDPAAALITAAIYEQLTTTGAADAARRQHDTRERPAAPEAPHGIWIETEPVSGSRRRQQ